MISKQTLHNLSEQDQQLLLRGTVYTQSLREEAFVMLLRSATFGGALLVIFGILVLSLVSNFSATLVTGTELVVMCWFAEQLRRRNHYTIAVGVFLSGAVLAIALTVPFFMVRENPFIYFLPVVVGVSGILMRPAYGFLVAGAATILIGAIAVSISGTYGILQSAFFSAAALAFLSAIVAWLSAQTLLAAADWAIYSYHKVERREQQLYVSEQQLQRALLDKDFLNGQLMSSNIELERARKAAEEANRLKSQFVANMSHELRTPLNAVIGFSYILKQELKGPLNPDQHDYIQRIYDSGEHLLKLLNDILDTAKLEAGRIELHSEPILLEHALHEALLTTTSLLRSKPIELRQAVAPQLPPVYGDQLRIAQVLLNLLSNAVKFTEQGSITLRAYPVKHEQPFGAQRNGKAQPQWSVVVEVADTGIGIAEEHLSLIFEEYRQADEKLSRLYGGTGLGLPISKQLVELHGGTLSVSSTLGVGSTFRFTIPVATTLQLGPVHIQSSMKESEHYEQRAP